jgi:hypothetical protein
VQQVAPSSANQHDYCRMDAQRETDLFGYRSVFVRAGGECYRGIQCHAGNMTIHADALCTSPLVSYPIDSQNVSMTHSRLGNVVYRMERFDRGTRWYSWVSHHPGSMVVVSFASPFEIFSFCVFLAAILGNLLVCIYHVLALRRVVSLYTIAVAISNFLYFAWSLSRMIYFYTAFTSEQVVAHLTGYLFILFNLATLSTAFVTTEMISFTTLWSRWKLKWLWISVLLVHVGLAGAEYFMYFWTQRNSIFPGTSQRVWRRASMYWIILLFVYDTIPAMIILLTMSRARSLPFKEQWIRCYQRDPPFFGLFAIQVLICILYFLVEHYRRFSDVWYTDRAFFATACFPIFFFMLHQTLNVWFSMRIKKLIHQNKSVPLSNFTTTETHMTKVDASSAVRVSKI